MRACSSDASTALEAWWNGVCSCVVPSCTVAHAHTYVRACIHIDIDLSILCSVVVALCVVVLLSE